MKETAPPIRRQEILGINYGYASIRSYLGMCKEELDSRQDE
jgi:hypothetical protein